MRFSLQFSFQLFAVSFETDRLLTAEHREQGMWLEGKVFRQVCHVKPGKKRICFRSLRPGFDALIIQFGHGVVDVVIMMVPFEAHAPRDVWTRENADHAARQRADRSGDQDARV